MNCQLPFEMQEQQQGNWCWAAVAASVTTYWPTPRQWGQCDVVNAELTQTKCCAEGNCASCNVQHSLHSVLTRVQHLCNTVTNAISYEDVCAELDAERPLCARIVTSELGHFVAITGYVIGDPEQRVLVDDPGLGRGRREVPYDTLRQDYSGGGVWTHTYYLEA